MGCTIRKTVSASPRAAALGAQASTAMYRMVQEALTNVRKYGGPNVPRADQRVAGGLTDFTSPLPTMAAARHRRWTATSPVTD